MGYSMGAFHAFFIAAAEQSEDNKLISFDRYITLDAQVQLQRGMEELDAFYNAPLAFPPQERTARIKNIIHKSINLAKEQPEPDIELPLTEIEAQIYHRTELSLVPRRYHCNFPKPPGLRYLRNQELWFRAAPPTKKFSIIPG